MIDYHWRAYFRKASKGDPEEEKRLIDYFKTHNTLPPTESYVEENLHGKNLKEQSEVRP
ncbi:hypothetical protein L1N85_24555 [Paenibacillus alkaliterrae]|uniref:hypothetical protein n=1 Tax=Paenibacillus alkaliterrae TaxID=320909 RepID=UPI001F3CF04D|nr:hypothetical protein [Paenibacillus alkaliterrae]MCF2941513.1 hypothetical protein [Paenibacillus alkaliterrae]